MKRKHTGLEPLAQIPLFSRCSPEQLRLLDQRSSLLRAEPGRVLVHQGGRGREFFVIISGRAAVSRNGEPVAELGPGDFFGELALLAESGFAARNATVTTLSPMEFLVFNPAEFEAMLAEAPAVTHKMMVTMAGRLRTFDIGAEPHT